MATTYNLFATSTASINCVYERNVDSAFAIAQDTHEFKNESDYTTGDFDHQGDQVYRVDTTVTSGSPNFEVDLRGTLEDPWGRNVDFETVKSILVRNLSETDGDDVYVGPLGATNPFVLPWVDADGVTCVRPSGAILLDNPTDGWAIEEDATTFRVQYQGTSDSIEVQIVVVGTHATTLESSSSSSSSSVAFSSSSSSSIQIYSSSSSSSSSSVAFSSSSSSSSVGFSSSSSSSSSSSVAFSSSSSSSSVGFSSSSSSSSIAFSSSSSSSSVAFSSSSSSSSSSSVAFSSSSSSSSIGFSSSSSSSSSSVAFSSSSSSESSSSVAFSSSSSTEDGDYSSSSAVAALLVTGSLSPDATGTYTYNGYINGYPRWTNGSYSISWSGGSGKYVIKDISNEYWLKAADFTDPVGTYDPGLGSGTATVAEP